MSLVRAEVGGLVLLQAPLLLSAGVSHAFSTRLGGVSEGLHASLDLGLLTGDAPAAVAENRARLCAALGYDLAALTFVHQVHGRELRPASEGARGAQREDGAPAADGLLLDAPGLLAWVRTADCLPVLLASDDGRRAAAVHAGWRGLAAGIIAAAVEALDVAPERLLAAIGPGIGAENYEVSPEVAAALGEAHCRPGPRGRPLLDLAAAAASQLRTAGVMRLDVAEECTFRDAELFFSHRRDGARTGRQGGFIACRA